MPKRRTKLRRQGAAAGDGAVIAPGSFPEVHGSILDRALPRAVRTIGMLLKLILPVSFAVGLLRWSGALAVIGRIVAPGMSLFHLPGETAVALLSGLLGGIYALIGAMAMMPLTPAQLTVVSAIALVAHNLIVECTVQDKAGTPWWWMLIVRLLCAALVGLVVSSGIAALEAMHAPALWLRLVPVAHQPQVPEAGSILTFLVGWLREAAKTVLKVSLIVTGMMIFTEWIRSAGILRRLEQGCRPLLRFFGLSAPLAYPWLTAQILGVAFGAGLLIEEIRERGGYAARDVRELHTSIGVSHSLFEDTVLLVAIGASLFWIIIPRVLMAAAVVRLLRPLTAGLRPAAADGSISRASHKEEGEQA
jgi:spore maturation protein SpmB